MRQSGPGVSDMERDIFWCGSTQGKSKHNRRTGALRKKNPLTIKLAPYAQGNPEKIWSKISSKGNYSYNQTNTQLNFYASQKTTDQHLSSSEEKHQPKNFVTNENIFQKGKLHDNFQRQTKTKNSIPFTRTHIKGHAWGKINTTQNLPASQIICKMGKSKTVKKKTLWLFTSGDPHNFVSYLQEVDQVLRGNSREKSPCASGRRRGKGTILKYAGAPCLSLKRLPSGEIIYLEPNLQGLIRT